jgi:hypothetical protein
MTAQRIGEINGRFATLLKFQLCAVPFIGFVLAVILIPLLVWIIGSINDLQSHHIEADIKFKRLDRLEDVVAELPPDQWERRIILLESLAETNVKDHNSIMIDLVKIKSALKIEDP